MHLNDLRNHNLFLVEKLTMLLLNTMSHVRNIFMDILIERDPAKIKLILNSSY